MKRREAMLLARGISETVLGIVAKQGKGQENYTLTHDEAAKLSEAAIEVASYLVVPRTE